MGILLIFLFFLGGGEGFPSRRVFSGNFRRNR